MTPFAVVLMEDEKSPHGEFIFGINLNNVTFAMGDPRNMYVIASHNNVTAVEDVVYYLGQAYCSFLDSTTKGDLLRSEHGIVTFNSDGAGMGHLSFNIKQSDGFLMGQWGLHKKYSYPVLTVEGILFDKIGLPDFYRLRDAKGTVLESYCRRFLFSSFLWIFSQMQTLDSELFEARRGSNENYKKELTTLANQYKREKLLPNPIIENREIWGINRRAIKKNSKLRNFFRKCFG
uniref:Uncharacterized protein n=1 Tax=Cacopsylla melanoneura TaxID=428564 RepID=A0A8D8XBE1_9HEMI